MEGGEFSVDEFPADGTKNSKKVLSPGITVLIIFIVAAVISIILFPSVFVKPPRSTSISQCVIGNGNFTKYVVVADSDICSKIGCEILTKGGNIIDAIIAAAFCTGVVNLHSTGIGGGGFMVYYNKELKKSTFVDFRETAPINVDAEAYKYKIVNKTRGVGSVAVPSFVPGVHHIWKNYGKIEWNEIVDPTRQLLEEGFEFSSSTAQALSQIGFILGEFPELHAKLTNNKTGDLYQSGEIYTDKILADTFKVIRDDPEKFIRGELGKQFFEDLCQNEDKDQCFLRDEDRFAYKIKESAPVEREVFGKTLYTAAFPSSAIICGFLMKVIESSNIHSFDKTNATSYSQFLHRYIEAMKFGYALRTHFGDPTDIPDPEIFQQSYDYISQDRFARLVADYLIDDEGVRLNQDFYNVIKPNLDQPHDDGTSHISILDSDGNGVAMTTTINGPFGSFVRSPSTGIIYNNEMDDFSASGDVNIFGFGESPNNFVKPGRRPLSSMSPSVVVDKTNDKAVMVSGASGGSRIISATTLTILNYLVGKMDIFEAMSMGRVHHQYDPNEVSNEVNYPLPPDVYYVLKSLGHNFTESTSFASVQSAVNEDGVLKASADIRKNGKPYGM